MKKKKTEENFFFSFFGFISVLFIYLFDEKQVRGGF